SELTRHISEVGNRLRGEEETPRSNRFAVGSRRDRLVEIYDRCGISLPDDSALSPAPCARRDRAAMVTPVAPFGRLSTGYDSNPVSRRSECAHDTAEGCARPAGSSRAYTGQGCRGTPLLPLLLIRPGARLRRRLSCHRRCRTHPAIGDRRFHGEHGGRFESRPRELHANGHTHYSFTGEPSTIHLLQRVRLLPWNRRAYERHRGHPSDGLRLAARSRCRIR